MDCNEKEKQQVIFLRHHTNFLAKMNILLIKIYRLCVTMRVLGLVNLAIPFSPGCFEKEDENVFEL